MHRSISIGPFAVGKTRNTIIDDYKVNLKEGADLSSSSPRGLLVCGSRKCLGRPNVKSRDPDLEIEGINAIHGQDVSGVISASASLPRLRRVLFECELPSHLEESSAFDYGNKVLLTLPTVLLQRGGYFKY